MVNNTLSGDLWSRFADNLNVALFIQNRNGDAIFANDTTLNWFGFSHSDTWNLNSYRLYNDGIIGTHILSECLKTQKPVTTIQILRQRDQTYSRPYLATQFPIFDDRHEFIYSIQLTQDVTNLNHRFHAALEDAKKKNLCEMNLPAEMIVVGETLAEIISDAYNIADCDATVLITGESGTGKECLAKYIHENSHRIENEFMTINCAALPENLLESELFGYEKGAFSGATACKPGLFEAAHGGTLLLDEIDSLPLALQGKLLRVIETKQVRRLGAIHGKEVDFRLITATNANLEELVIQRKFRLDLYHRLNVVPFYVPPLRERVDEIRPMCEHFLKVNAEKYHRTKRFSEKAIRQLERYEWPGNIRELRNFVERVSLLTDPKVECVEELSELGFGRKTKYFPMLNTMPSAEEAADRMDDGTDSEHADWFDPTISFKDHVRKYERWLVNQVVNHYGSLEKAARHMSVDKSTLIRKRKDG